MFPLIRFARPLPKRTIAPLASCTAGLLGLLLSGCGGSSTPAAPVGPQGPIPGASTAVALQLASTANGQFLQFSMQIDSITLTNRAGKTVTIYSTPTTAEFIAANAATAPFATVQVPQDVYTSAAITVDHPNFTYVTVDATQSINFHTDEYGYTPTPPVVILAGPLTVQDSAMGLLLDLQVSSSGSVAVGSFPETYQITPTFRLTPLSLPPAGGAVTEARSTGLAAQVTAINPALSSMTVSLANMGPAPHATERSLAVALNASTQYQGLASSASSLAVGTFVNLDVALQADASYAATRVEVQDSTARDVASGQLAQVLRSGDSFLAVTTQQQGSDIALQPVGSDTTFSYTASTAFQTSARFRTLGTAPFPALFDRQHLAAGQNVSIGSPMLSLRNASDGYPAAATVTLIPQTIDAVVRSVSTSGRDAAYTVQLATYDPIVQWNLETPRYPAALHLAHAETVVVYVSAETALPGSAPLAAGATFRFHGLLFNDSGSLRMICDQVRDGVTQ